MGRARFLYDNFIPTGGIVASSVTAAQLSRAQKEGGGSASMGVTGTPTATEAQDFLIRIDNIGAGTEIGQATFAWSLDDGATVEAAGVATSTGATALGSTGVSVTFTAGSGADFDLDDLWRFRVFFLHGIANLIDRNRDTEWRSASVTSPVTLTIDLGSAQAPHALVLLDHNLSAASQIVLSMSDDNFTTTVKSDVVTYRAGKILHYIGAPDRTHRYWRVSLYDPSNTDGYLRISELFLGDYFEPYHSFDLGDTHRIERRSDRTRTPAGRFYGQLLAMLTEFDLTWTDLSQSDRDTFETVYESLHDTDNHMVKPVLFNSDSDQPGEIYLCEWSGSNDLRSMENHPGRYRASVRLIEDPRTLPS